MSLLLIIILCFAPAIAVFIYASYQDDKTKFRKGALWILGIGTALLLLTGIINYIQNANFDNEKFGKKYNAVRLDAGIDTIPSNWTLKNPRVKNWFDRLKEIDEDYTLRYLNPDSLKNPVHLEKVIWIEGDQIKSELDYYMNKKQTIEVYYNHQQKSTRKDYYRGDGKYIEYTVSQIDSILSSWQQEQVHR